jgi:hypothetical protein
MKTQNRIQLGLVIFLLMVANLGLFAQAVKKNPTAHNNQIWFGYVTSTKISEKYSLWNDVHYVPESFFIIRTGLTRNVLENISVTGGYAFLKTAGPDHKLSRTEHRPWGQLQSTNKFAKSWSLTERVRYEARFRQEIKEGELTDDFVFNHRVRFLLSLRKNFGDLKEKHSYPYAVLSDEVLLNYGKEIGSNTFDQNRLTMGFGIQKKMIQYQVGVMNRLVQGASGRVLNHTLVLSVVHKLDFIKHHSEAVSE